MTTSCARSPPLVVVRLRSLTAPARSHHEDRAQGEARPQTTEQAVRIAHELLTAAGVTLSPSKVSKLCRDFLRADPPCTFRTYLSRNAAPAVASLALPSRRHGLEWVDPTGNTAASNADLLASLPLEQRRRVEAHRERGAAHV